MDRVDQKLLKIISAQVVPAPDTPDEELTEKLIMSGA